MTQFKWNVQREYRRFWDYVANKENLVQYSDKDLAGNPLLSTSENSLAALGRVVAELVELEEKRELAKKNAVGELL